MEEGCSSSMEEDFGFTFYDVYARVVGFDKHKSQMRKIDGVTTWYNVVCNKEGSKKSIEDDQANARSGPTLTFNVLKEILGGFQLVGCNVGDIRNVSRDIKAYTHGIDVQMVLDDMAKKMELSEAFTYEYKVNASNYLVALLWCDDLMKRNYHMFGGKDNHGQPVTFVVGLVSNENTGAFAWLLKHSVECMGVAPKMIVTDQDLGMRSAIEEILVEQHATDDLLEPDEFEEEWNGVVERYGLEEHSWFKMLYEYRQLWIHAYFRDFPLGSMIRTTSISKSENSFYKNFLKPRNNIAEFYLNFNQVVEFQQNIRTKLDYQDATPLPILGTTLPFEKHASTMYTDSILKKIQEEIVEGNDRCRVLGLSSTDMIDTYKLGDNLRNLYFVRHDKTDESY
ncbi:protein FAR1-RELATED SEQUENCE 5-like [Salvia hispanica]|uniref:protein FAR1-RELATED SEQUENCE 5-like n=1 Tax=Salvia hispanica TaxID=49212 RepID=UPI002009CAD2|nr:protein FAR1-RELATED SEQUENCE 5-like [Salvia hispanica]